MYIYNLVCVCISVVPTFNSLETAIQFKQTTNCHLRLVLNTKSSFLSPSLSLSCSPLLVYGITLSIQFKVFNCWV